MFDFGTAPWEIAVRTIAIYLAIFLPLRLLGKRQLGQFTIYDLVFVLLVANSVQPAITGPDSSLGGGLVIIFTLVAVNLAVSRLELIPALHRVFMPEPAVIIKGGAFIDSAMRREQVDRDECETAIREHGLPDVSQVALGVLEPDGTISIVPTDARLMHSKRRIRYQRRAS